ncbi:putative disease resistance protein RGA4 [Zingiber officinale]|uniref:putative disease resistance protein RGA4 n=1 Tax=Zingiber officinale TaxID=94328 RepID=UPI001C4B4E41|nr:putative disease resistance protein RGA4 [Zingiber officinale]
MSVFHELKHLLLQVLPSSSLMAQGRLLCIQNHLAMVCDNLWAINSMIAFPEMRMLSKNFSERWANFGKVLDVPPEFEDWERDVAVAVIDVGELLSRIMDWEVSLHRSIVGNTQQVNFRHVILVELKEMLCSLNSLVLRGSSMGLRRDPMGSMNPLREDYSIVLKNEVVDREEDLEKFIAILEQQLVSSNNNDDDDDPFVIVIDGEQGVGKTTLAHMIYHHTWVCQQFHHRIWVDLPLVSTFKTINIIGNEFVRSINKEEYCDQKLHLDLPLPAMWEYINEQLCGSRYLLVLHCENLVSLMQPAEWNELKNILLRVGGPRSGVLIIDKSSTQSAFRDMVFLNGMKDIITYCLNPLSKDAWVELFKRQAATTIPSLKQDKSKKDAWRFRNYFPSHTSGVKVFGLLSQNATAATHLLNDIYMVRNFPLVIIRLHQYHHLLDVYNDYDVILHMLTAEYLIPTEGLERGWIQLYARSLRYINRRELALRLSRMVYLHMKVPEDSTIISRCCRYLCLKISHRAIPFRLPTMPVEVSNKLITLILREQEEATQEDVEEITLQLYKKRRMKATTAISKFLNKMSVRLVHLRILVVETGMIQRLPNEVSKLVNLRYLHLSKLKMELLPKSLFDLPNLRILSLLRCQKLQKIPERIHQLKKLQILKLAYCTKLQQLPKSITRLKNLEALDVEGCCWLSKLPEDLVNFKSLRILNITRCASLSQIPHGIGQSISLRKLSGIFIGVNGGFVLTQLQTLTNLLEIRLRNLERVEKTQTELLMGQQSLRDLSLHWDGEEADESSELAPSQQVLEALQPNVHLKMLEIISYKGVEFPTWMSKQQLALFDSLVEVRLINLKRCATLPSLGQLPCLEKLEISGMDLIKHIDNTFYGDGDTFSVLRELTFLEMLALEKWSMPERKNVHVFNKLERLTLIQCPKLKEIDLHSRPCLFFGVTIRVWLNNETIWSVEFYSWENLQYIEIIEIVGCQELRCLPQGMQSLKHLSEMTINSCSNLTTLVALHSLEELNIYACPLLPFNLEAFRELRRLTIKGCPKMQM